MRPSFSLAEILPHRPPMVLIDEVVDFDEASRSLVAAVTVRERWCGNWVAIEYMAQAAAALAGLFDRLQDPTRPARPGFLLGTRRLALEIPAFEVGRRYLVRAVNEFADDEAASFSCTMTDEDGSPVATAILNAFRPRDIAGFLSEQR